MGYFLPYLRVQQPMVVQVCMQTIILKLVTAPHRYNYCSQTFGKVTLQQTNIKGVCAVFKTLAWLYSDTFPLKFT